MTTAPRAALHGVLLVDKPAGQTSFDVIRKLKSRVKPSKIGHAGTLDPMATGLLPLCIGEATKLVPLLAEEVKRYRAVVRLGRATTTLDREGDPTGHAPLPALDDARIEACRRVFVGDIQQVPPMYSAVKHRGRRMYELAREGFTVERKPRTVHIQRLELVCLDRERLALDVTCSSGTYIRTLAADLASCLGTLGYLDELVRTSCGGWTLDQANKLDVLVAAGRDALPGLVIPLEQVLASWERVDVDDGTARRLTQGQHLAGTELDALGLQTPARPRVVWFRPPGGVPLVLARIERDERSGTTRMRIVRVLFPRRRPGG